MKDFLLNNAVLDLELPRLKAKATDKVNGIFSMDQWYNRYKGAVPLTKAEALVLKNMLHDIRQELKQIINPRPLDELDDANK